MNIQIPSKAGYNAKDKEVYAKNVTTFSPNTALQQA